ncbi:helix-turn-helix domain-containing protein [Marinomonas sp. PE14-40]|uniref:helix-turn-helix domain-containing protein n=1 Tax=Marinomonas sp. PE14-40 TaxID=3060621 RepID=UPI003F66C660
MNKQNFADNLRLLCNYKKSISEVCRELEINRQQFNKYLSAKTTPSGNNLRRICDYFGLEEHEIYLPHEEFEEIIRVRPVHELNLASMNRPELHIIDQLMTSSTMDLSKYEGSYHIYYYSTSFPTQILKGYGMIFKEDGRYFIKWIERLSQKDKSSHNDFIYKIKGMVTGLGNRIFISGYEELLQNEMIHVTLFPTYKNKVSLLSGLMLGVSGTDAREPVSQRVILSYLGKNCNHKDALKACGIFEEDSGEIEEQIRKHISNDLDPEEKVFYARPL